jgi:hypothetical protein
VEPILSKKQNYRLWQSGAFGNKKRIWTVDEYLNDTFEGLVAIRMRSGPGGGLCYYNLTRVQATEMLPFLTCDGFLSDCYMINEMAPSDAIVLQGEYFNGVYIQDDDARWGAFRYSTVQLPMRDAFREANHDTHGLHADCLLRAAMTPSSYEDWKILLDQYPDHVLEVSIFNCCLGDIPGRNALVWEVRRY